MLSFLTWVKIVWSAINQFPSRAASEQQLWKSACFQISSGCSKTNMLAEKHPEKYSTYPEAFYSF